MPLVLQLFGQKPRLMKYFVLMMVLSVQFTQRGTCLYTIGGGDHSAFTANVNLMVALDEKTMNHPSVQNFKAITPAVMRFFSPDRLTESL